MVVCLILIFTSCSTTSAIPDGEQLFTGLKKTKYVNYEKNAHAVSTQEELDVVLTTEPNGSLFGSPYYRSLLVCGCGTPSHSRRATLENGSTRLLARSRY